jgi:hypothetical protein
VARRCSFILCVVSLLLCAAVATIWLRSKFNHDLLIYPQEDRYYSIHSLGGRLWLFSHDSRSRGMPMIGKGLEHHQMQSMEGELRNADQALATDTDAERAAIVEATLRRTSREIPDELLRPVLEARERSTRSWVRWQSVDATTKGPSFLGFHWFGGDARTSRFFAMPYWSIFVLTLALPAGYLILWLRARSRARAGRCPHCGYDLRASPGRCPECGATAAAPSAGAAGHN